MSEDAMMVPWKMEREKGVSVSTQGDILFLAALYNNNSMAAKTGCGREQQEASADHS